MPTFTGSPEAGVFVDGDARRSGVDQTFPDIIAGAGTANNDTGADTEAFIRSTTTTDQYQIVSRSGFVIDTSVLGSDTIDSGTFETWGVLVQDEFPSAGSISLCGFSPVVDTVLENADYGNFSVTKFASDILLSNLNTGATVNTQTLNAAGLAAVDGDGPTYLAIRLLNDLAANAPTWGSNDKMRYECETIEGTAGRVPLLTIEHTEVGGGIRNPLGGPMTLRTPVGAS